MICNTDGALYNFRGPLIKRLIEKDIEVVTLSSKTNYFPELKEIGASPLKISFDNNIGILSNLRLCLKIGKEIKKTKPDIIHCFTHKAAIFGVLASGLLGYKKIFITVTGLGEIFTGNAIKNKFLQKLLLFQYFLATTYVTKIFFQNPDDLDLFISKKILKKEKAQLTAGSGIDTDIYFPPAQNKIDTWRLSYSSHFGTNLTNKILVLFPSRAINTKGVKEFYEAARVINNLSENYVFIHAGGPYNKEYTEESLKEYASECKVIYMGYTKKINEVMGMSDVVVLPSYYREGTPRSLIEALSLGKHIITTNMPGCKETVINNWNGNIIPPKNSKALVSALLNIDNKSLQKSRINSRILCETKYNVQDLFNLTVSEYLK